MKTLGELIAETITAKSGMPGNTEFVLMHLDHGSPEEKWSAMIGNSCPHVLLGEVGGEFSSEWKGTPEAAVTELLEIVTRGKAGS